MGAVGKYFFYFPRPRQISFPLPLTATRYSKIYIIV